MEEFSSKINPRWLKMERWVPPKKPFKIIFVRGKPIENQHLDENLIVRGSCHGHF